jgi:hypothetical protein
MIDTRLAYAIETFWLDDEDDEDVMHAHVVWRVRKANRCSVCDLPFKEEWGDVSKPAAAYICRPMPRIPHKRAVRIGATCADGMTDVEIDQAIAEFAPGWAKDDEA